MGAVWREEFRWNDPGSVLCSRKELLGGYLGSSEADPLAKAPSLDGPSARRGFPFDVGVPLPGASTSALAGGTPATSPSALAVPSKLEPSHSRRFPSDFGVPLPSASPSTLLVVRRLRVPLPLPRAFPVGPLLPRGFPGGPVVADGATSIFRGLVLATGGELSSLVVRVETGSSEKYANSLGRVRRYVVVYT